MSFMHILYYISASLQVFKPLKQKNRMVTLYKQNENLRF